MMKALINIVLVLLLLLLLSDWSFARLRQFDLQYCHSHHVLQHQNPEWFAILVAYLGSPGILTIKHWCVSGSRVNLKQHSGQGLTN